MTSTDRPHIGEVGLGLVRGVEVASGTDGRRADPQGGPRATRGPEAALGLPFQHHAEVTPPAVPVRSAKDGWPLRREGYRQALEEGAVLFLAESEAGTVGFALVRPRPAPANLGIHRLLDVETVAVLPEARGAGIGGALMDAVEAWAQEKGIDHLQLSVRARNEGARR